MLFCLMRLLKQHPKKSQRDIARELGVSLGSVNYLLRALVEKGEVKVRNFATSPNKVGYAYVLTPTGLETRARLTVRFLRRKRAEYEALRAEIAALEDEVGDAADAKGTRA